VPRFVEQIRRGGPITVTHPDMRRFFMTIPEAVQLVLHAASQAVNGATYVLEMGEQVKLVDMARDMIRLSGLIPDEDVKIEFIGLRPGEKLYEELVGPDEEAGPSRVDKILRVSPRRPYDRSVMPRVHELEMLASDGDADAVLLNLRALAGGIVTDEETEPEIEVAASAAPVRISGLPRCPHCDDGQLRRSRTRGGWEGVRKHFTAARPFRCDQCDWRGWLVPTAEGDPAPVERSAPPDLRSLDAHIASAPLPTREQFAPRNLH
jgi:hypothetical protein